MFEKPKSPALNKSAKKVVAHAIAEAALFTQPRKGDPKLKKDHSLNELVMEKMGSGEAQRFSKLIEEKLGQGIIRKADEIIALMRESGGEGVTGMGGTIPHREDLREKIFIPHWVKFKAILDGLTAVEEMQQFAEEENLDVEINLHSSIFHSGNYLLKFDQPPERMDEWFKERQKEAREYREKMKAEKAWVVEQSSFIAGHRYSKMNPLLFEEANRRERLDLKLLDEIMGGDWTYGSAVELGPKGVYKSGSFTEALTSRMLYIQEKWKGLNPEDRKAWIEGDFTHSRDAIEGRYDLVRIASPDHYVG